MLRSERKASSSRASLHRLALPPGLPHPSSVSRSLLFAVAVRLPCQPLWVQTSLERAPMLQSERKASLPRERLHRYAHPPKL